MTYSSLLSFLCTGTAKASSLRKIHPNIVYRVYLEGIDRSCGQTWYFPLN